MEFIDSKFKPVKIFEHMGGIAKKYKFPNGFGASVIKTPSSYGGNEGLWELAVLDKDGRLTYETHITSDVLGHLSEEELEYYLNEISKLKEVTNS